MVAGAPAALVAVISRRVPAVPVSATSYLAEAVVAQAVKSAMEPPVALLIAEERTAVTMAVVEAVGLVHPQGHVRAVNAR